MNSCPLVEINWLSVVVVTIISFSLGALWHHKKLFGKAWNEDAKPVFDASKKSSFITLFGLSALLHFIAIAGLDYFIGADATALSGLFKGLFVSIGFIFTSIAVTHLFVGRSFRLILIDAGFYVVLYSIAGLILGAW
jgi:hypothetical protein